MNAGTARLLGGGFYQRQWGRHSEEKGRGGSPHPLAPPELYTAYWIIPIGSEIMAFLNSELIQTSFVLVPCPRLTVHIHIYSKNMDSTV